MNIYLEIVADTKEFRGALANKNTMTVFNADKNSLLISAICNYQKVLHQTEISKDDAIQMAKAILKFYKDEL